MSSDFRFLLQKHFGQFTFVPFLRCLPALTLALAGRLEAELKRVQQAVATAPPATPNSGTGAVRTATGQGLWLIDPAWDRATHEAAQEAHRKASLPTHTRSPTGQPTKKPLSPPCDQVSELEAVLRVLQKDPDEHQERIEVHPPARAGRIA